jgi:SEC-C motif-containing protein
MILAADACPCGSGRRYSQCCQPWHDGAAAPTAEALMRSRYTAYVLGMEGYLLSTWHPSTRPEKLDLQAEGQPKWLGLTVKLHLPAGDAAQVEFVARYREGGRGHRLHEISRFVREDGRWSYVDGDFPHAPN